MRFTDVPVDYEGSQRCCREGFRKAAVFLVEQEHTGISLHEQVQRGQGKIFLNPSGFFIDYEKLEQAQYQDCKNQQWNIY